MNKIICAIIKDEHNYIEEWVEWHHDNVGIDKIYLIEDINSKSHKDILAKYNYVELYKLLDIVSDEEIEYINKKYDKVIIAYYISYRLWKPKADWMLFIDVDEFLDCDKNILNNILKRNYDKPCVTMTWQNMKCDGHIKHPNNHKKYSLLNTYKTYTNDGLIEKTKQIINCNNKFNNYTCIDNWEWMPHKLSEKLNNFDGNLKLKHFFSKSFEEYKEKLEKRGQCSSGENYKRGYDQWFLINTEYDDKKKDLFEEFNIDTNNLLFSNYNIDEKK